ERRRPADRPNDKSAWSIVANRHEPLVSQEVFDAAQNRLVDHARGGRGPNLGSYLFSCLGACMHCGRSLRGITRKGHRYSRCNAYNDEGKKVCQFGAVREDVLLAEVLRTIKETFLNPEREADLLARARKRLETERQPDALKPLRTELEQLEKQIAQGNGNLLLLPADRIPDAVAVLRGWEEQRDRLRADLADRERGAPVVDLEEVFAGIRAWLWQLEELAG